MGFAQVISNTAVLVKLYNSTPDKYRRCGELGDEIKNKLNFNKEIDKKKE